MITLRFIRRRWLLQFALLVMAVAGCDAHSGSVLTPKDGGVDGGCQAQLTCADYPGAECGVVSDGCGGTFDLVADCSAAGCTAPEICNGGGAGETVCGTGVCTPSTCADFPSAECGDAADGCGGTLDLVVDCGASGCTAPEICGGGGVANECGGGCTPQTCTDFPSGECGTVDDGCGGTLDLVADCGAAGCTAPDTCGGGGSANQCGSGCVLLTCADFPAAECGTVPDGCGGTLDIVTDCGGTGCTSSEVCGGSGNPAAHPIFCGDPCPSRIDCNFTNSSYYECGVVSDNCGGTLDMVADCGAVGCTTGEVCAPHSWGYLECTTGPCTPLGCGDFPGLECGLVNDGCGGILDLEAACGAPGCTAPESCGGGAQGPNHCGDPSCPFPQQTCADFATLISDAVANGDPLCGVVSDGCGGSLDLVADCGAPGCGPCVPSTPLAPQCSTYGRPSDPLDSKMCLENVSGCPGQIVDMDLYVIVPTTCANGATSQRAIGIASQGFELLNPQGDGCGVENCIRRELYQGDIHWIQFPGGAIGCSASQCPDELPTGHVDTWRIRIPVNQPAGDYPFVLVTQGAAIYDPCGVCPGAYCETNQPTGMVPTARVW